MIEPEEPVSDNRIELSHGTYSGHVTDSSHVTNNGDMTNNMAAASTLLNENENPVNELTDQRSPSPLQAATLLPVSSREELGLNTFI